MNSQEIREFYQKNKVVAIGVPVILGILILDNFVLKPRRTKPATATTQTADAASPAATATPAPSAEPIQPPPPLITPNIPPIDPRVDSRFIAQAVFPHGEGRNVFLPPREELRAVEPVSEAEVPVLERPDISYHGFFTMGLERVAIIKVSGRLALSRLSSKIPDTPFRLQEIAADKVILTDTENDNRPFEVGLVDDATSQKSDQTEVSPLSHLRASSSTP
ncbi:MAG TPA: hypothetical protein PLP29_02330 [Candidatus Ozemobacteraceae bacterium]|mgnify:CR=1 FL=1|nr:hypothetical protein [Candidatus Ozemobacteraceae bacterium]